MDEKIRAKRTAIERATPDARECALQKLKSEKVTYKSMEKVDFKNLNSSPPSQDTLLSAKALKEKNMRDVIAQKEQAERSRFAGVLDAEEKRWSTEKEGNLHSFLSTLQYVCTFSLIFIYHSGVLSCELTCEDI